MRRYSVGSVRCYGVYIQWSELWHQGWKPRSTDARRQFKSHSDKRRGQTWKTMGRERLTNTVPRLYVRTIFLSASFHCHSQSTALTTNTHHISRNMAVEETSWVPKTLWLQKPHYIPHFLNQRFLLVLFSLFPLKISSNRVP